MTTWSVRRRREHVFGRRGCRKCGQATFGLSHVTQTCPCWKMRLPKRKEK